jgi:hypothetical protein
LSQKRADRPNGDGPPKRAIVAFLPFAGRVSTRLREMSG